jgi:hypothetical protein
MSGGTGASAQLVVIAGADRLAVRRLIERRIRVDQEVSDRVMVVSGDAEALKALAALPEIVVEDRLASPETIASLALTEGEKLFVAGWLERRATAEKKVRRGEGLGWDAEGFEPP